MHKWVTVADIPDERHQAGHIYEYVLTERGGRDWSLVIENWPRLAREFDGAFLVIKDGCEVRAAYFFDGIIPDLTKGVYMARVQK